MNTKLIEWVLRIAVAGEFMGRGRPIVELKFFCKTFSNFNQKY